MNIDNDTAAPVAADTAKPATPDEATPVATAPAAAPKKTAKKKAPASKASPPAKAKVKAAKPKAEKISDEDFSKLIIETVYALRKNNMTAWVDLRNKTKEGEALNKLLTNRPTYRWRKVGESWYLESKHDGNDTCVAYVLPHDPGAEYRRLLREYQTAIAKRKSKKLKEPKRPESMKKSWRWVITSKRGNDEHDGTETNYLTAQEAVMRRQHLFAV